jgi:uncharacterized protein involved in exopolysaccharide biosynthesis
MPDIFDLLKNWWKQVFGVVILSILAVGIITYLKPRQYLSVATAIPSSAFAADKSTIFSNNIRELYASLGTPDDLDMILGTAKLDTVYLAVTDQFNLFDHYKVKEQGEAARVKSALLLKKNTRVIKSDYGELKVKVWDTDRQLAPQLANAIMKVVQDIHSNLKNKANQHTLDALLETFNHSGKDSTSISLSADQKDEYMKLISEYQVVVNTKSPALLVVENARASSWPDRPKRIQVLAATAVLGFLFALLTALVLERRKKI